jgi:aldehyde dehydrogenase (NAD+)
MDKMINLQRAFFNSNETKPVSFRVNQLKKLKSAIKDNENLFYEAILKDFRKSEFEAYTSEISFLFAEIDHSIKHIERWSERKKVATNLHNLPGKSFIIPEPLGVTLIIGAWNYPYLLSLGPVIASMTAGNCVILKPSELPIHSSNAMKKMVTENFDEQYFSVIEGGVEETSELLKQKFDKIFFTGSTKVGKIVYKAAAENLTPVTLELGGKSPAIIDKKCHLKRTVQRLVWGKFFNAGQTCVAPDYVLVHEEIYEQFLVQLKTEIQKADYQVENQNYVQIVNDRNFDRIINLIDKERVILGGNHDKSSRFIEPTVLSPIDFDHAIMQEEIFGPILPIIPYSNLDEVIKTIKELDKPLSCYVFSKQTKIKEKILNELSFGGGCINDTVIHLSNPDLPLGGVGASGMGSYHGEAGFRSFSHYKSILNRPTCFELSLKYTPRTKTKLKIAKKIM